MRVLIIHNEYARRSGEEVAVERVAAALRGGGCEVCSYTRSSAEIDRMVLGQVRAFFSGVYSRRARRDVARLLAEFRPDAVNVHNVFPLISPSVLLECRRQGVPVVMTVHNYRLLCPNGLFYSNGEVCERCLHGCESACVLRNCEQSLPKSLGYALRNLVARKAGWFRTQVAAFITLTRFQRGKLIEGGFAADRITVLPNAVAMPDSCAVGDGEYVAYAGRISHEKGIDLLLDAARRLPHVPFRLAGAVRAGALSQDVPANVQPLGHLAAHAMAEFYRNARVVVLASRCYEALPTTLIEAMAHGRPVIGPAHGGVPEIITAGKTGLLFPPGDATAMADRVRQLWDAPARSRDMGLAGRADARARYSLEHIQGRLLRVFERVSRGEPVGDVEGA
ncbi:MAG: hypothetical protein A3K19_11060 [Lentisphaerae bacterium RIFOXYB12_FULL_65_16]|nr:MAG: hypothetical protein A3K18_31430 [Lentisphaerae bacterium RIFOXYA12_64_32]OGV91720.1 MAG: hypothetical protein A3K19_11060 [Lentisphaerae bacterium RIFOXYB12_FULL_65_16]